MIFPSKYTHLLLISILISFTKQRTSILSPSASANDYSSLTNKGTFSFSSSSESINVYSNSQKVVFLTSSDYFRASSNQSLLTGFFYIPEERNYLMSDDLGYYNYLLSDFSDIKIKINNSACRFPFAFTSENKVNFTMLSGVLEIITEDTGTSILDFLDNGNTIKQDEWISVHPLGNHSAKFLYVVCPFYEDKETKLDFNLQFFSETEIMLGGNLAESLILAMENEPSVEEDQIVDQLKEKSPIEEDVSLPKYGSGKIRFMSTEDFTIKSNIKVHHTVILRLKSDLYGFSQPRLFNNFDLTLEFDDDNRDQVDSVYFLFENDLDSAQEVELLLSKFYTFFQIKIVNSILDFCQ